MSALAREEHAAETLFRLMPRLSREEFCRRMAELGDHPDGRIAQAYTCFLLLRRMPPSREKAQHWEEMTARLRQALDEKERDEQGVPAGGPGACSSLCPEQAAHERLQ